MPKTDTEAVPERKLSGKALLILGIAAAGLLALLTTMQTWVTVQFAPGVAAVEDLSLTGQGLNSSLTLISLAALAATLVLTIAGRVFRWLIGVLVAALGAGLAALGIGVWISPIEQAAFQIGEVTGISGEAQAELVSESGASVWPLVTAALGVVLAILGVLVVVTSGRWKSAGRKYDTDHAAPASRPESREATNNDRISEWDALSDGDDPTDSDR